MKHSTFTDTSHAELVAKLAEERKKLAQLMFDLADKKLKRTSDIPQTKKTIARILTRLSTHD